VKMPMFVFCVLMQCELIVRPTFRRNFFNPEDGDSAFSRNVGRWYLRACPRVVVFCYGVRQINDVFRPQLSNRPVISFIVVQVFVF